MAFCPGNSAEPISTTLPLPPTIFRTAGDVVLSTSGVDRGRFSEMSASRNPDGEGFLT